MVRYPEKGSIKSKSTKLIMSRPLTALARNIFIQNRSEENKISYTEQRNFCVSL